MASKYGIEAAIIIHNLHYWILKNVANKVNNHDGRFWTYNSSSAFGKLFPYMGARKVYRVLNKLAGLGSKDDEKEKEKEKKEEKKEPPFIIIGNFNRDPFDHARWYSFTDEALSILSDAGYDINGFSDNVEPIDQNLQTDLPNLVNRSDKNGKSNTNSNNTNINNTNRDIFIDNNISFDSTESNASDLFSDMAAEDFADYNTPTFDAFWNLYDKKMGKVKVKAKWDKLSKADKKAIMDYLPRYVESTPDKQYRKHPLTFLNQESWNDEIIEHKTLSTSDYDRKSTSSNVLRTTDSSGDTDPSDIKRWEEPARKCVEWMQSNDIHFSMTTQDFRSCYEYVEGCVKAMAAILMQYKGVQFPGFVKLEVDKRRREEPFSSMISEYVREHNSHK